MINLLKVKKLEIIIFMVLVVALSDTIVAEAATRRENRTVVVPVGASVEVKTLEPTKKVKWVKQSGKHRGRKVRGVKGDSLIVKSKKAKTVHISAFSKGYRIPTDIAEIQFVKLSKLGKLSDGKLVASVGNSQMLYWEGEPYGLCSDLVSYKVSNEDVATVSYISAVKAEIKPVKTGKTKVSLYYAGKLIDTCSVEVKATEKEKIQKEIRKAEFDDDDIEELYVKKVIEEQVAEVPCVVRLGVGSYVPLTIINDGYSYEYNLPEDIEPVVGITAEENEDGSSTFYLYADEEGINTISFYDNRGDLLTAITVIVSSEYKVLGGD